MSATHKHALFNLVVWLILLLIWHFFSPSALSWLFYDVPFLKSAFHFALGGAVYDLDHILYFVITTKPLSYGNIKKRMDKDFEESNPHFYICHTIEFIVISIVCAIAFNMPIFLISIMGWILHMIVDTAGYIFRYRSHLPWLPYFSFVSYYLVVRRKAKVYVASEDVV